MNLKSVIAVLACFLFSSTVYSQKLNIVKKVKNANGIEVTFQSSYKGHVSPGGMLMRISGDQVALTRIQIERAQASSEGSLVQDPDRPVLKQPQTFSYMDYGKNETYRVCELPNGKVISSITPFTIGKGFQKEVGEETILGLKCKIIRAIVNSNTIDISYTQDIPFRGLLRLA